MMTPRLLMNSPCTYNLDAARSVNVSSYMDRLGFSGMSQAWKNYVRRMYDEFDAIILSFDQQSADEDNIGNAF